MEFEQIIKRLDWLDEEHRKDKNAMTTLGDRMSSLEGEIKAINKKLKQISAETSKLSLTAARIDNFDSALEAQRTDITKLIEGLEKRQAKNQLELEKRHQIQIDSTNKAIGELQKTKDIIADIKREMKARNEEDTRRRKTMTEWETKMQSMIDVNQQEQRARLLADESHRQDSKRLTDLQGEVSALRKRLDEFREKNDIYADGIHHLEIRLIELAASESERRNSQTDFFETQARQQVERDQVWKQWEERFEILRQQTESMDSQIAQWDTIQRAVKRAQETYEEIAQKFDRRINEITEMQRLSEDRFRQEWVTFKADDQKRWTVNTLSQEEIHKDTRTNLDKIVNRLTAVEDLAQMQQDVLQQTKEANEQLFQGMLAQIHELLSAYERIMGTAR